jgi:predicted ATP-grasp superfamily ATP-dependent carboligase
MKIAIVYPKVCSESAKELATLLKADKFNAYDGPVPRGYDLYFNYGVGGTWEYKNGIDYDKVLNKSKAIRVSRDKIESYKAFNKAGVPTCEFVESEAKVPKDWEWVVCRETTTGRNCEGVLICPQGELVPRQPLYTKFFNHDEEHRIVVFKGKVVARYMKSNLKGGEYELILMQAKGYEEIDNTAITAAAAVGLDYAGVDCLFDSESGRHLCLEINSGPLLTDDVAEYLSKFYKVK